MEFLTGVICGIVGTTVGYFLITLYLNVRPISDEDAHALITNRGKEQVDDETNHDGASR